MKIDKYYLYIIAGSVLLFFPFLGAVHLFDWDEINFAECAREMLVSKDYLRAQIDFAPFWEKPPVFIWEQVLSMKLFGVNEFAARLPNALMGALTLCMLYNMGKRIYNDTIARYWVVLYAASWLPHFYFKTGIIDPTFNFFIFIAYYQLYRLSQAPQAIMHALWAGIAMGIAVLTKGPVAILVVSVAIAVHWVAGLLSRKPLFIVPKQMLIVIGSALIPFLLWCVVAAICYGMAYSRWFVSEFIAYQLRLLTTEDSDHGGPIYYHAIVLLIGCFPASVLLFQRLNKGINKPLFHRWLWVFFIVVLVIFSIVKTKIVHYSSLCYFPITGIAAAALYEINIHKQVISNKVKNLFLGVGLLLSILLILLPIIGQNATLLASYISDPFVKGNLQATVKWNYLYCLPGVAYLSIIVFFHAYHRTKWHIALTVYTVAQILVIQAVMLFMVPQIEAYSQRAVIEYYKSFIGKDVYVKPLGFKSYAYLFYTLKQPSTHKKYYQSEYDREQWLITGDIDKPAYFVCKQPDSAFYAAVPTLTVLYSKNGFVFLKRK
ncbi:MAG: glycosyltransferase family 39 protein [Chitinophagia bacterium]|nr:glycosyltransferase family 39 protein [Chitinophagia bacterium]